MARLLWPIAQRLPDGLAPLFLFASLPVKREMYCSPLYDPLPLVAIIFHCYFEGPVREASGIRFGRGVYVLTPSVRTRVAGTDYCIPLK